MASSRLALLIQLPIPPPGPEPVEGNAPLAAGYLKLYARRLGLEQSWAIDIFPARLANTLGDQALVEEILSRRPALVGFSCYIWNIERTLWIAEQLKSRHPAIRIVLGGPEITPDNAWTLAQPAVDYACFGEGEATFAELLAALPDNGLLTRPIAGLWQRGRPAPLLREPLDHLELIDSPYVEGLLDVADDGRMMLETMRGCRFGCKYCYYGKGFHRLRFFATEQTKAGLRYALEHGADEIVLLDPTLNQRPDFTEFLHLLIDHNQDRRLTFFGELRAEGIDATTARLLRKANFREIEIGLQSVEPEAWRKMGRPVDLAAFERGVKAMKDEGIKVCVDLIVGLPGDTSETFCRGIEFLQRTQAYSSVQVFNLSILPGTAFRREAVELGLQYQPWPPYYVLKTPTLDVATMFELVQEAQEAFDAEYDPIPEPIDLCTANEPEAENGENTLVSRSIIQANINNLETAATDQYPTSRCDINLDQDSSQLPPASQCAQGLTLHLQSADFKLRSPAAVSLIEQLLDENPFTTLLVVLEPLGSAAHLTAETLETLLAACYRRTTYLDRYYSLHPGRLAGAKQLAVLLRRSMRDQVDAVWLESIAERAHLLWRA